MGNISLFCGTLLLGRWAPSCPFAALRQSFCLEKRE